MTDLGYLEGRGGHEVIEIQKVPSFFSLVVFLDSGKEFEHLKAGLHVKSPLPPRFLNCWREEENSMYKRLNLVSRNLTQNFI